MDRRLQLQNYSFVLLKEYSKNFAAYANNIEASVEKFEQAVEFFKKNKIVL